jgi:hypothetical protein
LKEAEEESSSLTVRLLLQFEVGKCCLEMLENKMRLFERSASDLEPRLLQKMAYYCDMGIDELKIYVDMILKDGDDSLSDADEEDRVRVARAWYLMARLYNKFFTPDRTEQLAYSKNAICYYTRVADVGTRFEMGPVMADEIRISVETSDLLRRQVKMQEKVENGEN